MLSGKSRSIRARPSCWRIDCTAASTSACAGLTSMSINSSTSVSSSGPRARVTATGPLRTGTSRGGTYNEAYGARVATPPEAGRSGASVEFGEDEEQLRCGDSTPLGSSKSAQHAMGVGGKRSRLVFCKTATKHPSHLRRPFPFWLEAASGPPQPLSLPATWSDPSASLRA